MGRKLKPSDGPAAIEALLMQSMAIADKASLFLTSAYLAMAFDALCADSARQGLVDDERPLIAASLGLADQTGAA